MKSLSTILLIFFYSLSFGQTGNKWKINQVDFKIQPLATHNFSSLTYSDIQQAAKDQSKVSVDMSGYDQIHNYGYESDMFSFHLSANKQISENWYHELGIGLGLYDFGEFLVEYQNQNISSNLIGWCRLQDRYEFNASYYRKYMDQTVSIKVGPVLSYSKSFYDEILLMNDPENASGIFATEAANQSSYVMGFLEMVVGFNVYRGVQPFIGYSVGYGSEINKSKKISAHNYSFGIGYQFGR